MTSPGTDVHYSTLISVKGVDESGTMKPVIEAVDREVDEITTKLRELYKLIKHK